MALTGFGIRQEYIAEKVGITKPTLEKHYRYELDCGKDEADYRVVHTLHRAATTFGTKAQVTAAIWWTKARMGWKETQVVENTNPGVIVVGRELSEAEWLKKYGNPDSKEVKVPA